MSWDPLSTFSPAPASAAPESQVTSSGPQPSVVGGGGGWGSAVTGSQPRVAWPYKGRSQGGLLTQAWRENPDSHCLFSPSQPPGASQEDRGSPPLGSTIFPGDSGVQGGEIGPFSGSNPPDRHQPAPGKNLPYRSPRLPVQPSPLTEGKWSHREGEHLGEGTTPAGDRTWGSQVTPCLPAGVQE